MKGITITPIRSDMMKSQVERMDEIKITCKKKTLKIYVKDNTSVPFYFVKIVKKHNRATKAGCAAGTDVTTS